MLVLGNACISWAERERFATRRSRWRPSPPTPMQMGWQRPSASWPLPKGVSVSFLVWHQACKLPVEDTASPFPCVSSQTAWPGRGPLRMKKNSKGSAGEGTGACCPPHRQMKNLLDLGKTPVQLPAGVWGPASISLPHDADGSQLAALLFPTLES